MGRFESCSIRLRRAINKPGEPAASPINLRYLKYKAAEWLHDLKHDCFHVIGPATTADIGFRIIETFNPCALALVHNRWRSTACDDDGVASFNLARRASTTGKPSTADLRSRRPSAIVNHKRLFRLYREERLMVRRRGGRKRALGTRAPLAVPTMA